MKSITEREPQTTETDNSTKPVKGDVGERPVTVTASENTASVP